MSHTPAFSFLTVTTILISLVVLYSSNVSGYVVDDSKDLILSYSEKRALDKLKFQVMDILPEDFMKSDFYLIRWIRMANLDIKGAEAMLLKNIQWREKQNISSILNENFSDLEHEFHVSYGGRDKGGRPVGTMDLGEWDLLGAVISGRKPRLQRYMTYLLEVAIHELFKAQRESVKSITRGIIIIDGDGGSIRSLCPACISIFMEWITQMENYYPKFLREIIVINAPSITQIALKAVRPASQETSDIIHIFNMDRRIWMEYLDKKIDKSQRPTRYGGTRKD